MFFVLSASAAAQTEPASGEITAIDEKAGTVRINLGRASGLKAGDGLRIFSPPEIITLPGTDKPAYAREREIGAATVVEVLDSELVAQVTRADETIAKGCRALAGAAVKRGPMRPYIRDRVKTEPAEAAWGREVTVELDIEDLDGDLALVECWVDGGLLLDPVAFRPRVRWLPPAEKRSCRLAIRATDRSGLVDVRAVTLKSAGVPVSTTPVSYFLDAIFGKDFLKATDLASDRDGNLYVLDEELRRIVKWGPMGRAGWTSDRHGRDLEFVRLVVDGADGLLVDATGKRVLRYRLAPDMFAAGPVTEYGGGRRRPGSLRKPRDVAVVPDGSVWVLDAAGTIKTYAPDGSYQTTVGEFDEPAALRLGRGGIVRVLDLGRRRIDTFEASRLITKDALPEGELPVDFEGDLLLFAGRLRDQSFTGARGLRRDAFGRAFVMAEEGATMVRLDDRLVPRGRRGGLDTSTAVSVRASADGGFRIESAQTSWTFDADGWFTGVAAPRPSPRKERDAAGNTYALGSTLTCNGAAVDLPGLRAIDFDVDPFGRVLVLEKGTGRVMRLAVRAWRTR